MTLIHIIDDDRRLLHALAVSLRAQGYEVQTSADATSALREIPNNRPDLAIVDLGLPDFEGSELVRRLRRWLPIPIIVLSARDSQASKVSSLDAGADDYVTKPFGIDELTARIRAALRRAGPDERPLTVRTGSLTIDVGARRAEKNSKPVSLSPTEWNLLGCLIRMQGQLVPQQNLLDEIWGPGYPNQSNYLRVYIARLRRKLESDPARPKHIVTVPGMGYRFDA